MMLFPVLMILRDEPKLFWVKILVAALLLTGLYFLVKFSLRRLKFKKSDLKAAGLNHQQQREWLATHRRKNKSKKRKLHF